MRSAAFAAALTAATVAAAAMGYGRHAAVVTAAILLPLGLATVAAAHGLARHRRRVGGLRRQFALVAGLAFAQLALAVGLFVQLMFVSAHDAFFTVLVALYAGSLAVWAARLLGLRALADVTTVRATLGTVAAGRRDVRTGVSGRDEVAALAADVDAMIDRLDGEERARAQLIAAVSHDLRTPLTSLRLLAEALGDDLFEPDRRRAALDRMTTNVRALSTLIDDLFELTRLQSGDLQWSIGQVRLDDLVVETVEAMRPQATAHDVAVHADLPHAVGIARANPEQVQRVLFNLIQNAIRHTPADGSVVVRAHRTDADVQIEVADTGTGIAEADRERVFDAFVRAGADAPRTDDGAGLGLAISRAIVEAHGGRIWVGEAPVGTSVRFTLPAS